MGSKPPSPDYLSMTNDEFEDRIGASIDILRACKACPRRCGVDRIDGMTGYCRIGRDPVIASYGPHYGEEAPISGWKGSGTIFYSGCNLKCAFCQNYNISQDISGTPFGPQDHSRIMISLQDMGCHNINLVSPTHVMPQVLEAIYHAARNGLRVPIVYNSGGYDPIEALRLLEGIVDIYMPDMKYSSAEQASRLSDASDYPDVNRRAMLEMHRQVGDMMIDGMGLATRGLLVRHLILPEDASGTQDTMRFLADSISIDTYVNIMDQYRPSFMASFIEGMDRRITNDEYERALRWAKEAGLHRFDV
ncbi:MAG: radical SAM protein [Candidatus Thermoplasmatota archaeon]|nr:radical SAM protein [Candidatus Thermoplasmatota archaeon]